MDRSKAFAAPGAIMRELLVIAGIFVAYALLLSVLSIGCPIKFFTGMSCPGCGLTRAWTSLLSLHLLDALAYHPLFWLPPIAIVLSVLPLNKVIGNIAIAVIGGAFIVLWILRFFLDGDVLLPQSGYALVDIVNWSPPPWWSFIAGLI